MDLRRGYKGGSVSKLEMIKILLFSGIFLFIRILISYALEQS